MMRHPATRRLAPFLLAAALLAAPVARAGDEDEAVDQETASKALEEGRIRPLAEISEKISATIPGTIMGVELEAEEDGPMVYEFAILNPDGKLMEVDVDAATAEVLSIEDED